MKKNENEKRLVCAKHYLEAAIDQFKVAGIAVPERITRALFCIADGDAESAADCINENWLNTVSVRVPNDVSNTRTKRVRGFLVNALNNLNAVA